MKSIKKIISYILALTMIMACFSPLQAESVGANTKKTGINKTQVTMYPGESVKLSVSGAKKVKWKSSKSKLVTVNQKGTITAKKSGSAKITATIGKKTYSCKVTIKKKPAVTRGEWISALLKQVGIKTSSISSYHFSDTKQYGAGKAIETAYYRNIIPIKKTTKNFYPNSPATREFMAVTAVRAMGFKADASSKLNCSDKGKLKYAAEDKIAINQKFIVLKKGKFLPASAITKAEEKKALAAIKKIRKSEQVSSKHKDIVTYQTGVVQESLKMENDYTVSASGNNLVVTIPQNENTRMIQTGKVIVLPQKTGTQERVALKVTGISDDGYGNYRLVGETPEISAVYKTMDVQEEGRADMSDFEANSDVVASADVSVFAKDNVLLRGSSQASGSTTAGKATTLYLKETNLGSTGTVKGSVELSAPKVSAIVDADYSNPLKPVYHQVTVALEEDVTAKATLKFSSKGSGAEKIYLGHVTASLGYGLFVDVLCYLNISADGEATVQYTLANTVSVSYINGDFRMDAKSDGSWEGTRAEITGQVLGEPQINLRILGCWINDELYGDIPVIGVQADFGPKFKASVKVHDTKPKTCTNLSIYAYLSVGLNTDSGLGKFLKKNTKLKLSKTIWEDNAGNPLRAAWHYEDGVRTKGDVCTYQNQFEEVYVVEKVSDTYDSVLLMYNSDGLIDSLEHSEYYRGKIEQKNTYKLLYDNMITTRIETRIELYGDSTFDDSLVITEIQYNEQHQIVEETISDSSDSDYFCVIKYSWNNGRISCKEIWDPIAHTIYSPYYDEKGNIVQCDITEEIFSYKSQKRVIKLSYDKYGNVMSLFSQEIYGGIREIKNVYQNGLLMEQDDQHFEYKKIKVKKEISEKVKEQQKKILLNFQGIRTPWY